MSRAYFCDAKQDIIKQIKGLDMTRDKWFIRLQAK